MRYAFTFLTILVIWLALIALVFFNHSEINNQNLYNIALSLTFIIVTVVFVKK